MQAERLACAMTCLPKYLPQRKPVINSTGKSHATHAYKLIKRYYIV